MKVKELITILQERDPESEVLTWDPGCDRETYDVYVSDMTTGTLVTNIDFGPLRTATNDKGAK